jgi:hypothetical protein
MLNKCFANNPPQMRPNAGYCVSYSEYRSLVMSDGREEREEQKARIEQQKQNRDKRDDFEYSDEWKPERPDS